MSKPVRQIIRDKRQWHTPPDPAEEARGFHGWRSRGYLPHFDSPGLVQMITYRLADALPASRRHEWSALLEFEDEAEKRRQIEIYLDRGFGECHLRDERIAGIIQKNLLHFDGIHYRLLAWVVMPNHVHVLIEIWQAPLSKILNCWKSFTAKEANRLLGRTGEFWQPEYFDRYIRDEEHLKKAMRYIENNPVKARLVRCAEDWPWSSSHHKRGRSAGSLPAS
jgi:REP element-mobilizing transposase RayT